LLERPSAGIVALAAQSDRSAEMSGSLLPLTANSVPLSDEDLVSTWPARDRALVTIAAAGAGELGLERLDEQGHEPLSRARLR
jgi:hypothetical protein